jgi:mannan endo-1,4-beta-mannosidase
MMRGALVLAAILAIPRVGPFAGLSPEAALEPVRTADRRASQPAVEVLRYLAGLPRRNDGRVVSGQNLGSASLEGAQGYATYFGKLKEQTGKLPALIGVDYGWDDMVPARIAATNTILIRHWNQGGLVTVSMSPRNPWTGGGVRDRSLGGRTYRDVLAAGTDANKRLQGCLDRVAAGFAELRDAGVVVLWRPFHEMNGDFFWWSAGSDGGRASIEEFRALWRYAFDYFTAQRQLNNLVWVYAPNAQVNGAIKPVTYYYPGGAYVDIVGLDYYGNTLDGLNAGGGYDALLSLGKPCGLTEIGPAFWLRAHPRGDFDNTLVVRGIRSKYPAMVFFLYWHGWSSLVMDVKMGIVQNKDAAGLLNDPWVITLDEMPVREGRPPP